MENLTMKEIYVGTEKELHKNEEALKEADEKIEFYLAKASEAEAEMRKWQAEAEKVEAENQRIRNNVTYLRNVIENFQKCDFAPTEEELNKEIEEQRKKEAAARVKDYNPAKAWCRKKGNIGQYKPDGNLVNSWHSQRSAAEALGWSQTGVGKFMKLERANQIRRKGFYLEYMG